MPHRLTLVEGAPPHQEMPMGYDPAIEDVAMPIARELDQRQIGRADSLGAIIGPYAVNYAVGAKQVYFRVDFSSE